MTPPDRPRNVTNRGGLGGAEPARRGPASAIGIGRRGAARWNGGSGVKAQERASRALRCSADLPGDLEEGEATATRGLPPGRSGRYLLADQQRRAEHRGVQARVTGMRLRGWWRGPPGRETEQADQAMREEASSADRPTACWADGHLTHFGTVVWI